MGTGGRSWVGKMSDSCSCRCREEAVGEGCSVEVQCDCQGRICFRIHSDILDKKGNSGHDFCLDQTWFHNLHGDGCSELGQLHEVQQCDGQVRHYLGRLLYRQCRWWNQARLGSRYLNPLYFQTEPQTGSRCQKLALNKYFPPRILSELDGLCCGLENELGKCHCCEIYGDGSSNQAGFGEFWYSDCIAVMDVRH